jgi:hypothetical protein
MCFADVVTCRSPAVDIPSGLGRLLHVISGLEHIKIHSSNKFSKASALGIAECGEQATHLQQGCLPQGGQGGTSLLLNENHRTSLDLHLCIVCHDWILQAKYDTLSSAVLKYLLQGADDLQSAPNDHDQCIPCSVGDTVSSSMGWM